MNHLTSLVLTTALTTSILATSGEVEMQRTPTPTSASSVTTSVPFTRGPYLQTLTSHSVIIRWQSELAGRGFVRYGERAEAMNQVVHSSFEKSQGHRVSLRDLKPDTRYFYAVGLNEALSHDADMHFKTAPLTGARQPVRIWVTGDSGDVKANNGAITRNLQQYLRFSQGRHTDLWLMLGDNAYYSGTEAEFQQHLFEVFPQLLKQTALWPAYGNHDAHSADAPTQTGVYFDIFDLPKNAEAGGVASGTEAYFSFDYANIHLVNLDSAETAGIAPQVMENWLRKDLAANAKTGKTDWLIAFFHHPPYSKGSHDSDNAKDVDGRNDVWGGVSEMKIMRERFVPILEQYSVDLVLTGHSHNYERSMLIGGHYGESTEFTANPSAFIRSKADSEYRKPLRPEATDNMLEGSIYVVAGSAAKNTTAGSLDHPVMLRGMRDLGTLIIDVEGLRLNATMLNVDGETKDTFTLHKTRKP